MIFQMRDPMSRDRDGERQDEIVMASSSAFAKHRCVLSRKAGE